MDKIKPRTTSKEQFSEEDYDVAIETLLEAQRIRGDKELMDNVMKYAKKKAKEIKTLDDVRAAYDDMVNPAKARAKASEEEEAAAEEIYEKPITKKKSKTK